MRFVWESGCRICGIGPFKNLNIRVLRYYVIKFRETDLGCLSDCCSVSMGKPLEPTMHVYNDPKNPPKP